MGRHQEQCNRFPSICLTTEENPGKPQLGNPPKHSSVTSHCFKWGPFPLNEVARATLPAPLAKPIGPRQKTVLKYLRSGIRRSRERPSGPLYKNSSEHNHPKVLLSPACCCLPVEPAAAPNRFKPKPRGPSLVGHLPRVSYVCLVGQSLKGRL